jgi:hypothetical protein
MKALISRMLPEEIDKGYLSPHSLGTTFLSITVKDGTATIDFNEKLQIQSIRGQKAPISQLRANRLYRARKIPHR